MTIAILSHSSAKYKSNKQIIDAGKKRNHNVIVLQPKHLIFYLSHLEGQSRIYTNENGILERLPKIDCIIPRVATDISYCASIIDFFTFNLGVYSTQSGNSIRVCSNKWLTLMRANEKGIKVPKTIYCSHFNSENLDAYVESLKLPLVLKLNTGSQGVGVMLFSEKQSLKTTAETFSKQGTSFILQEMIKTKSKQHDFRTIIINNDCVATMKKTVTRNNEFRTNLARKGTAEPYELNEKERLFCLKVAQSIGGGDNTFGIDWMVQDGEPVLIEINSNYGTKIIDVVGHNFFEDLFFHMEIAVEDFKKLKKQNEEKNKERKYLLEEIQILTNELSKKNNILTEILENEKMKNLFRSLKGKKLGYIDSEKKEKEKKIMKPKDIIEMMTNMLEIEK